METITACSSCPGILLVCNALAIIGEGNTKYWKQRIRYKVLDRNSLIGPTNSNEEA